ncbi:hypothetical protein L1765_02080 [Microaerobacter geothermalis]|uniref:hypothetical protein n=1 Tax=Microaerobacter geothermalis TaxID=674972 RepID=UPI001F3248EE|nr:hypothetical protein [Microaerobacter geothermalis]MCF6092783.1 hypothetical protein [Microaerobacter geothermalis]
MDERRKQLIIQEIKYWQKNKLLPDHYCLFLLHLYSGDGNRLVKNKRRSGIVLSILAFVWMIAISYFVINFTRFSIPMQIIVFSIILFSLYISSYYFRTEKPLLTNLLAGLASIFLIGGGILLLNQWGKGQDWLLFFLVISCFVWLLSGVIYRISYLFFCGLIGLALIYGWAIYSEVSTITLLVFQLYWLPFALIFILLSLWLGSRFSMSGSIFLTGLFLLFGPEIESLYLSHIDVGVIQFWLFSKIFVLALMLIFTRKRWLPFIPL